MTKSHESKPIPKKRAGSARSFKQARASQTAERILLAANRLLSSNQSLSNEAIAEKANVSVSSIYRYFRNRDDLFAEMFRIDADQTFELITQKIGDIQHHHYRTQLKEIIEISIVSVSGDRAARANSYGHISFDTANEININFNVRLKNKLIEQVALISNCHPRYVDESLVLILSRLLVSTPRLLLLESPEKLEQHNITTELTDISAQIFKTLIERAEKTRSNYPAP